MESSKVLNLGHEIVHMQEISDNRLAIADKNQGFRIIDNTKFKNIFSIKLSNARVDKSNHNIAFSEDGKYLAYSEIEKPIIRIVDTTVKKVTHSFLKHIDEIESLAFSPDGKYLASGGIDGKIFLWSILRGAFISRYPSHPDYVAFLRFSPNNNYLLSCGFEGSMICTNIHTKAKPKKYKQHKSRVTAITFLSEHIVITGSKEGEIVVMNYLSGDILARFMTPHGEVRGLCSDSKVIYVSGIQHAIAIYDINNFEAIATHYISAPGVPSAISLNEDKTSLIVGCLNGKLAYYNLANENELEQAIEEKNYKEAYNILHENPILEFSQTKKRFDELWEKSYNVAFALSVKKQTKKAEAVLESFQGIPKITNKIQILLKSFSSYERFTQLISTKKLPAAYSMAEQYPTLKKTPVFLSVEKLWYKTFEKAKKIMLERNDSGTAKLTLSNFNNVPSKMPIIQTLVNDPNVFKELIQGLKEKDFKKLLTVIAKHGYLKETTEYQEAMELAQEVLENAKQRLKERDFETVHSYANLILSVPHLHEQAKVLDNYAVAAQKFISAYDGKKYDQAYTLLDTYPFLIELDEAKKLEDRWKKMIDSCEQLAFSGNVKEIKETLGDFFTLKSRANRIGSLLRMSYLVQIKKYASSPKLSNTDIVKAINTYIMLLSYDPEIEVIIKKLRQLRQLELELGENEMEPKEDDVWLKHSNGNIPYLIFQTSNQ